MTTRQTRPEPPWPRPNCPKVLLHMRYGCASVLGMDKKLSARQVMILNFITSFINREGFPPTVREIKEGCAISSTSVVAHHMGRLERKGYIEIVPDKARAIRVLK